MELRFPSPGLRLAVGATPAATTFFKGKVRTTISLNTARMNSCPLGMERGLAISWFFYRQRRTFFTAKGRFLNRGCCCRHAKRGVGDGRDDKKENLFSDWRHRQPQKGEADNSRHGFLYLHHPLIEAADNGLVQRQSFCFLLRVTPSAKHNTHCDAPPYYIYCCRPQLELLPLGMLRWGFLCIMFSPFLLGNIVTCSRIFISIYTIF